jgi:hypothetical protein
VFIIRIAASSGHRSPESIYLDTNGHESLSDMDTRNKKSTANRHHKQELKVKPRC